MGASYWIKLYHEVLNDPKMGRLSDRLWRRVVECFLLAGEQGEGGFLPSIDDMAWTLRCDAGRLESELKQIAAAGIVELRTSSGSSDVGEKRWFVVKFAERQAAVPAAERKAQQRKRDKRSGYYVTSGDEVGHELVTKCDTEEDKIREEEERDEEREEDTETPLGPPEAGGGDDAPAPWSVKSHTGDEDDIIEYHRHLSGCTLNKAQASLLVSGAEALGVEKVRLAIKEWLNRGHKPWNVEGILDVARNGWTAKKKRDGPRPMAPQDYLSGPYADIIKH